MRLSPILFHQHMGRMFQNHWKIQGKKVLYDNGALKSLKEKGIECEDAVDFLNQEKTIEKINNTVDYKTLGFDSYKKKPISFDETHPDFKEESALTYGDQSVLLEGLAQAQVLTNSIILDPGTLPLSAEISGEESLVQDKLVRRCIRSSLLFDAWQEKLPKRHDPLREAWNFPRDYGITDRRRNSLLVRRLIQLCSSYNPHLLSQRAVLNSPTFKLPYTLQSGQKVLFSVRGDTVIFGNSSPSVGSPKNPPNSGVPDISPLEPTISLQSTNFYQFEPLFPVNKTSHLNKIHTVAIHYNETEVSNIFESPVSVDQILGRTLVHSWIYAMSQALQNATEEPVTVQTVQTDGKFFHFGVLQLNPEGHAPHNFFWSFPVMNIFEECSYVDGVPVLEGYNPSVFRTLLAFYNNS